MVNDLGPQSQQLRQMVAARLRAEILEGILMPGEWLRQEALARRHGVSQTPVREALKQLAAEGLVEDVPYRGVRVVALRSEDVEDLYSCRAVIESRAARFAAANITDDEIEELEELYQQMVRCPVPERLGEYRELNRQFHAVIIAASRRSFLVRNLAQLWSAFPSMLWSRVPPVADASAPGRDEPDTAEHAEIVAALRKRDSERAARAVRHHIEAACIALLAAMESQSSEDPQSAKVDASEDDVGSIRHHDGAGRV
jgi:DNA-binding GntR family transcriptional regulator